MRVPPGATTISATSTRWRSFHAASPVHRAQVEALEDNDPPKRSRGRPRKEVTSSSSSFTSTATLKVEKPTVKKQRRRKIEEPSPPPPLSAVAKGTAFEHLTLHLLRTRLHMPRLERTGGAGDRGIDLTGWWYPPYSTGTGGGKGRVRVLVQCKHASAPLGPVYMRELEGTLYRKAYEARRSSSTSPGVTIVTTASAGGSEESSETHTTTFYKEPGILGILASSSGFSSACAKYTLASPFPLLLLHIPPSSDLLASFLPEAAVGSEKIRKSEEGGEDEEKEKEIAFAALPNLAFVHPHGLMQGRLEFRPTRRLPGAPSQANPANDEDEEASNPADPALTIDSPELLLDGRPLLSSRSRRKGRPL
ncbi:hypothetical protein OC834_004340 [Tilletia horrida]|nr:hypothetical protein OC834_004340 [Tilletia horrida]